MSRRSCKRIPTPLIVFWCLIGPLVALSADYSKAQDVPQGERVLSVGGSVTEIVFALGEGDRLVARDTTSSYPHAAQELPDVGYMRALTPEGVLSVSPDLVIAEDGSGPPETIDVLQEAAVEFVTVPSGFDPESVRTKIEAVAAALEVPEKGARLADEIEAELAEAAEEAAEHEGTRSVLFILSTQGGRIMASGTGTAANGIIELAGGRNAITEFAGYKPLTDEAIIAAAPDVILTMQRGGDHSMPDEDLFALPAIASTPAAEDRALVRMDGLLLLGFGPRTPQAVRELNAALYGTD